MERARHALEEKARASRPPERLIGNRSMERYARITQTRRVIRMLLCQCQIIRMEHEEDALVPRKVKLIPR